jgi:creatinine amidohydrolase
MRFAEMTWPQLRGVSRDTTVVLAPLAACEQHGHHMPVFTDTILVTAVAEAVEKAAPETVLLLPTVWMGASHHHLPFGGTLSFGVDGHVDMICELLTPLLEDGHQRVMVLNGHGGNIDTMQVALRRLQPRWRGRQITAASYWDVAAKELAALAEGPRKVMGHACEFETSMILALRPDLVQVREIADDGTPYPETLRGLFLPEDMAQRTKRGAFGYPELASAEKGRAMLAAAVTRVTEVVKALAVRPLPPVRTPTVS